MRVIQRLMQEFICGDELDILLAAEARNKGAFTEVWLNMPYGYPTMEENRKLAKQYAEAAKKLRDAGIHVSLQISNTIGHGLFVAKRDCSGLLFEGSPVQYLVGHDGTFSKYSYCWNGKFFRDYICESTRIFAEAVQPEEIWIDDDLRVHNHAPVQFGCFCEDCIARFNARHGYSFTREKLAEEYLHGEVTVRENWIGFLREGIGSFTEEICKAAVEVCPDVTVGLQNSIPRPYIGLTHDHLFDAIRKATGKAPLYRPGGGAYTDHIPSKMVDKMLEISAQVSMCPDYVKEICPEIESTPDTAMGKTMYGTAMETTLYFAAGATDISYANLGMLPETIGFYEEGFALNVAQRPYWEKLAAVSAKTREEGICYVMPKFPQLRFKPDVKFEELASAKHTDGWLLPRSGIPLTYTKACKAQLLHRTVAEQLTDEEITALLKKNVITDGITVAHLQERGFDLGFEVDEPGTLTKLLMVENFTDHPVNNVGVDYFRTSTFVQGGGRPTVLKKVPEGAEVLGTFEEITDRPDLGEAADVLKGAATVVFDTKEGGKWAVCAYTLWVGVIPTFQRNRLLNLIDYVSGGIGARLLSRYQAVILPRVDAEDKTLAVSVLNCTIEPQKDIRLLIRNPKAEKFTFDSQYDGTFDLPYEKTEDGYIVTIPKLFPWSVGTVFAE